MGTTKDTSLLNLDLSPRPYMGRKAVGSARCSAYLFAPQRPMSAAWSPPYSPLTERLQVKADDEVAPRSRGSARPMMKWRRRGAGCRRGIVV